MIIPLYDTTANAIADKLVAIRREGGVIALSRVLTLLVPVGAEGAEAAIEAANDASMEHPCRVIVLVERDPAGEPTLDAEIRIGGDAGASEVVVLRLRGPLVDQKASLVTPLLLPDVPVVTWWPDRVPETPAAAPLGTLAQHRVTDSHVAPGDLADRLATLRDGYTPGDTDLAWTRVTWWRAHLAALLDASPGERVTSIAVTGPRDDPSRTLLAAWLAWKLRCPAVLVAEDGADTITRVELRRPRSTLAIARPAGTDEATLITPGRPDQRFRLEPRSQADCLSEELRRLDQDVLYGEVIHHGLAWLAEPGHLTTTDHDATVAVPTTRR